MNRFAGIGIDLVELDRFQGALERRGFRTKVFTPAEIKECESKPDPLQSYAARFAIKEAFYKALADPLMKSVPWNRMSRRQDLPRVYVRCGVVYVLKTRMILEERTLYGERIHAIDVPIERAVGIDTPLDLKLAEVLMRERVAAGKGKRTS